MKKIICGTTFTGVSSYIEEDTLTFGEFLEKNGFDPTKGYNIAGEFINRNEYDKTLGELIPGEEAHLYSVHKADNA